MALSKLFVFFSLTLFFLLNGFISLIQQQDDPVIFRQLNFIFADSLFEDNKMTLYCSPLYLGLSNDIIIIFCPTLESPLICNLDLLPDSGNLCQFCQIKT